MYSSDPQPLVQFRSATIQPPGCEPIVRNFNWTLREGETWTIVGPTGSGKSTIVETLLGKLHLAEGELNWPLLTVLQAQGRTITSPSEIVEWVSAKEASRLFSYRGLYYQQRYEFADEAEAPTVQQFLTKNSPATEIEIELATRRLGIQHLLATSLIKLSNGETRRTRIARALIRRAELIILEDPMLGLDVAGQRELDDVLKGLVRQGTRLLLITREDAIPSWVTHRVQLSRDGVMAIGPVSDAIRKQAGPALPTTPQWSASPPAYIEATRTSIVELRHVNVSIGGKPILQDISWTVREGERWSLTGPNGSGKTTLLSLLCGDHPQAFCNHVKLFGIQRGSGESIWDVKRRVGLLSPELHLYFPEGLTATEVAISGFSDVLSRRPAQSRQLDSVAEFFRHFGITHLADRCFARLSIGEQRLVLFVRALIKEPPLMLLDEPFQGLDSETMTKARAFLDHALKPHQSLIFVTHREEELPTTLRLRMQLSVGKVVHFESVPA